MAATDHTAGTHLDESVYRRRWWILTVLCLSLLIVFIGNTSLNVTIPTLARQLHATQTQLQWVIALYSLVFAGLLFTAGALGDRFGRKGALQFGLVVFLTGCVLASTATQMWQLIALRGLMGVGAAFIMPSTLSILVNVFPPHERQKAIAIWAGVTGGAGLIGPVMSGFLLGHFWYGSVFLINVPFVLLALVAGAFIVPKSKDPAEARLDPIGAVLSIIGLSTLVYALIEAPESGWTSPTTLLAFGTGLAVLAGFVFWERHTPEPMLDMSYFANPAFSTGTGGMILVFMGMVGAMFLFTQYFQLILGYTPLGTAVRFLPMAPIMLLVAPMTPKLTARFGANRVVACGMGLLAIGMLAFRGLDTSTSYWYILACFIPMMVGIAMTMSPMTAAIMSAVPARRAGAGSAMNDATRELGTALGVAVMGSVAASNFAAKMTPVMAKLPGKTPEMAAARKAAESSLAGAMIVAKGFAEHGMTQVAKAITTTAQTAFVDGIHLAVTVAAALAVVAGALVFKFLPRDLAPEGALHGGVEALEDIAELGIAGVPPVFADTADAADAASD